MTMGHTIVSRYRAQDEPVPLDQSPFCFYSHMANTIRDLSRPGTIYMSHSRATALVNQCEYEWQDGKSVYKLDSSARLAKMARNMAERGTIAPESNLSDYRALCTLPNSELPGIKFSGPQNPFSCIELQIGEKVVHGCLSAAREYALTC